MADVWKNDPDIRVEKVKSLARVRLRTRVKLRWHRWRTKRKMGQAFLDMLDECGREAERAFIIGQEFDVD